MARAPGATTTEDDKKPGDVDPAEDSKKPSHSLDEQTSPDPTNSTEAATWGEKD